MENLVVSLTVVACLGVALSLSWASLRLTLAGLVAAAQRRQRG